jgi:rod shape determining protein RodA
MREQKSIFENIDWLIVVIYLVMVLAGWMNIYSAVYNEQHQSIFDISQSYGKQTIWIFTAFAIAIIILVLDGKFYAAFSYLFYGISILALILVLFFGTDVSGSKSWFRFGDFGVQPAEFAKFATNMALAKYLSTLGIRFSDSRTRLTCVAIILAPLLLILVSHETGVALVFLCFSIVLYREGLSGTLFLFGFLVTLLFILTLLVKKIILLIAVSAVAALVLLIARNKKMIFPVIAGLLASLGVIFSVDYVYNNVLEAHQKKRIEVLLGKDTDLKGAGYNVNQSLIAIGSGGLTGKGFLHGTQTKFDFVPEQSTDFIFCTVGEEWGFVGSTVVIGLFLLLLYRIVYIAERQKSQYTRIYGYGVASILFFHLVVNIGMTIGLMPVIGIPLPFFSYGGSSLWSFTILLFILLKLDSYRMFILR